jgi:hypothetical protein
VLEKCHINRVRPAAENECVAVRGCLGGARRTHHSTGAGDVFDDHLLTQDLGHAARHDPPHHIGAAAGSPWHHEGQRAHRPILPRCWFNIVSDRKQSCGNNDKRAWTGEEWLRQCHRNTH